MPKEMLDNIPPLRNPLYLPPDVFNPYLHPPPGEIDVLNIVENGIDFLPVLDPPYAEEFFKSESTITNVYQKPGKGIYPHFYTGSDGCDGTLDSWCDRGLDNNCMLRAHNDGRNGFFFDSLSGWLIVNIPKVKRGYIVIKVETWHFPGEDPLTEGWTAVDNESLEGESVRTLRWSDTKRNVTIHHKKDASFPADHISSPPDIATSTSGNFRQLKKKKEHKPCDAFRFEYAIDDRPLISLGDDKLKAYPYYHMQRVVETLTLLEEQESWTEERDVQLAIRITGCERDRVWSLNNVYWA
jgi:hypothetical protein